MASEDELDIIRKLMAKEQRELRRNRGKLAKLKVKRKRTLEKLAALDSEKPNQLVVWGCE